MGEGKERGREWRESRCGGTVWREEMEGREGMKGEGGWSKMI